MHSPDYPIGSTVIAFIYPLSAVLAEMVSIKEVGLDDKDYVVKFKGVFYELKDRELMGLTPLKEKVDLYGVPYVAHIMKVADAQIIEWLAFLEEQSEK